MRVHVNLDARAWREALETFPADRRDVYFSPDFHQMHADNGDGVPFCCLVEDGRRRLLVPGLRCDIHANSDPLWDLQTCRTGCAGPLSSDDDPGFLDQAWSAWASTVRREGAVAAFFRLHPVLGNERWLPQWAQVREDRPVVFVSLDGGREAAWSRADSRHRNMVRKAQRLGTTIVWNEGREQFANLYDRTMSRLRADAELRLSSPFFAALWKLPWTELATVNDGDAVVAGAVFLFGPRWGHYYLAARESDAGNQLGNVLIEAGLGRAAERGLSGMYLGGGRSTSADDELLRFKRSIGPDLIPYRVARVPIDEQRYAGLVADWTGSAGVPPTWLLGYRQPRPTHA